MNMEYQSLLHKKLHDGVFVFTAETTPPDSSNKDTLFKTIKPLKVLLKVCAKPLQVFLKVSRKP